MRFLISVALLVAPTSAFGQSPTDARYRLLNFESTATFVDALTLKRSNTIVEAWVIRTNLTLANKSQVMLAKSLEDYDCNRRTFRPKYHIAEYYDKRDKLVTKGFGDAVPIPPGSVAEATINFICDGKIHEPYLDIPLKTEVQVRQIASSLKKRNNTSD